MEINLEKIENLTAYRPIRTNLNGLVQSWRKERRKVGKGSMTSNSKIAGAALTLFGCISIAMSDMYPWQGYYGYPLIVVTLVIAVIVCLVPGVMLWRREAKTECQRKFAEGR